MTKDINKVAIKFIKKHLKGSKSSEAVVDYLEGQSYSVVFYTAETHTDILKAYKALEHSKTFKNFTVHSKSVKSVFILKNQSTEEKYIALLHEAAHIFLGHVSEDINTANVRKNEAEAEAFVYAVINQKKNKMSAILCVAAALLICPPLMLSHPLQPVSTPQPVATPTADEEVYITSSGSKYHRQGCIYIKDKDCTKIAIEQAQRTYAPCKVCNP